LFLSISINGICQSGSFHEYQESDKCYARGIEWREILWDDEVQSTPV